MTSNVTAAKAFVKITPPSAARLIPNVWGFKNRPLVLTWALCGSLVFADEACTGRKLCC